MYVYRKASGPRLGTRFALAIGREEKLAAGMSQGITRFALAMIGEDSMRKCHFEHEHCSPLAQTMGGYP